MTAVMRKESEFLTLAANQFRQKLMGHNYQYVRRAITEHSKLLVEELKLDPAQQEATVRDDERKLDHRGGWGRVRLAP